MVRVGRVELPHLAVLEPKSSVSTSSTTLALVRPVGLEPTTTRLEGGCSIQLSYRREAYHLPIGHLALANIVLAGM